MKKTEILSPAGSRESLEAAVRSGADAVYLGATLFSARRNAENFDEQQLYSAVEYCHIRGVKVYLALNTVISDRELVTAFEVARTAQRAGVDAVIVQDLGLAAALKRGLPQLELHASTQMSVHSPSALPILKELGISRVVAAREMSAKALAELCQAANELDMTVEVFVHGALCMSVSGQCLMSAVLGGRSGNRGLCAGPCRLPFAAEGGTGYDLSLKDLSLLPFLGELAKMGVASFKIEGRMKRPEYVAAATAAARAALDTGDVPQALAQALQNVFSRSGFTDGYYTEKLGRDMFGIRTQEDVTAAALTMPMLHEIYRNERQNVPVAMEITVQPDTPTVLRITDGENMVTVSGAVPQRAENRALDEETVITALSKLGGTPYILKKVDTKLLQGLFLRGADLNSMRRDAVALLSAERAKPVLREEGELYITGEDRTRPYTPKLMIRVSNAEQIPEDTSNIEAVIYPLELELPRKLPQKVRLIADVPRGILSEAFIKRQLLQFKERGFSAALCGNLAAVRLASACGMEVVGGTGLNIYNGQTAEALRGIGVTELVLSPELTLNEAVRLKTLLPKGIFAYGRLPLMLTRNCPAANGTGCDKCDKSAYLTDRLGKQFPVRCRAGFSEVLNSLPLYLGDRLKDTAGLDFLMLYFTDEAPQQVSRIITAYKHGAAVQGDGFTRGLYYRTTF